MDRNMSKKIKESKDAQPEKKDKEKDKAADAANEINLSVEETNKLRISLGLKPLKVERPEEKLERERKAMEQHQEAERLVKAAELQSKLDKVRKQRELNSVLVGKSIAEEAEDEDTFSWIKKSREREEQLKREKEEAAKRAKRFDEQDEDLEDSVESKPASKPQAVYSTKDLAHLKVDHSIRNFDTEQEVILTLKDKSIIKDGDVEDDEEELENIHLAEQDRQKQVMDSKKKKSHYDYEYHFDVATNQPKLLPQYDEQTEKESFSMKMIVETHGNGEGGADDNHTAEDNKKQKQLEAIRKKLRAAKEKEESSELTPSDLVTHVTPASDYLTEADLPKKPIKKKKLRKKKAEDNVNELEEGKGEDIFAYLKEDEEEMVGRRGDHGSRKASAKLRRDQQKEDEETKKREIGYAKAIEKAEEESKILHQRGRQTNETGSMEVEKKPKRPQQKLSKEDLDQLLGKKKQAEVEEEEEEEEGLESVVYEDDDELYQRLAKLRRLQQVTSLREQELAATVAERRVNIKKEENDSDDSSSSLIISSTAEFCRNLHLEDKSKKFDWLNSIKKEEDEDEDEEDEGKKEKEKVKREEEKEEKNKKRKVGSWVHVDPKQEPKEEPSDSDEEKAKGIEEIIPEQPLVVTGVAATLALLRQQGEGKKEKEREEEKAKARKGADRVWGAGEEREIRIDHMDSLGRPLDPKEAFRQISHRFHGKAPGKNKQEKMMRKMQEEEKRKKMASGDTPLNSLHFLQKAQEKTKQPFVVLSKNKT